MSGLKNFGSVHGSGHKIVQYVDGTHNHHHTTLHNDTFGTCNNVSDNRCTSSQAAHHEECTSNSTQAAHHEECTSNSTHSLTTTPLPETSTNNCTVAGADGTWGNIGNKFAAEVVKENAERIYEHHSKTCDYIAAFVTHVKSVPTLN
jgi:hypothetical protein